jgi:hypothetical protein
MPQSRHPTAESVRVSTEAAQRFLRSIREVARIAEWDLQNEAFREHVQCLWQVKRATQDVLCVLAELQWVEWIQQFAQHFPFLLFMDDDALLTFLTKSVQQLIQYINDYSTTIGDLWLRGCVAISTPRSIFDVPGVLLEALQEATVGPSMLDLFMDQQQRRYDALFIYLLCHAATNLCDFKSSAASPYSLSEWQLFFQEYVWRCTSFSFSSDVVKSMVAMYWFDNFLTPSKDRLPYDLELEQIDKLINAERRDKYVLEALVKESNAWLWTVILIYFVLFKSRLEIVAEVTQLDYYLVVSVCADRLITTHPNDESAWKIALRWYKTHVSASVLYMKQLKEIGIAATSERDFPHFNEQIVYPFLVDLKVSCHFASPLRWNSVVRLAFDLTELECLSHDEKSEVWQCLYHQMLWNDYPVLFYNFYLELRPEFRMQTIDFLLAAPRSSLAFHVLFCDMTAFREDVQGIVTLPLDVRSYIHRLVAQMLWRLLFRQYSSLKYFPVDYCKILLADEMAVDDTTLERRMRLFVQDALTLPPTWRLETLDDHWKILFEKLADVANPTIVPTAHLEDDTIVVLPPFPLQNGAPSPDIIQTLEDSTAKEPITGHAPFLNQAEEIVERIAGTNDQHDEFGMEEDAIMDPIHEPYVKALYTRGSSLEKDVLMEEDDDSYQKDDNVLNDVGEEADVAMDEDSEDAQDEEDDDEDEEETGVQEVFDVDDSSDESLHRADEDPPSGIHYAHRGAPEEAEMLEAESTETEMDQSEDSSSSSRSLDDEFVEMEDEQEEVDEEEDDDDVDAENPKSIASSFVDMEDEQEADKEEEDGDETVHPKSIASSYIGSEMMDHMRDGNDPDDDDNEDGYDAEESQDAATEEENEDHYVGGHLSMEEFSPGVTAFHEADSAVDRAPVVPIVTHNEASTLVDKGYEPDSQGQTDVEGVPQPLRIIEAGYDAEDSQGHTEDDEVFDEDDEQPRHLLDNIPSIRAVMMVPPSNNGSPRMPPHVPRHTLSTDDMIADDEAESSEIEGELGGEPLTTIESPCRGGSLLMQVAASIQNEHFLTQTATQSQESQPHTQPPFNDDLVGSHDRSDDALVESIVDSASEMMTETANGIVAESVSEMIVERASKTIVEKAREMIAETAPEVVLEASNVALMNSESFVYPLPEADEESESSDSVRSHPGDEISCPVSVASSPQSSVGMQSAAKSETVSPPTYVTGQALVTTPREEQRPLPKGQAITTRPRSRSSEKKMPLEQLSQRVATRATAKKPSEGPNVFVTSQRLTRSRATAQNVPELLAKAETPQRATQSRVVETPQRTTRSRATAKKPPVTPVEPKGIPAAIKTSQRASRSRATEKNPPVPSSVVETPQRATRSRATEKEPQEPSTVVETPQAATASQRATRSQTATPVKPPREETPGSTTTAPPVTRVTRSRAFGKPPAIPVDNTKPSQRVTRSKRGI